MKNNTLMRATTSRVAAPVRKADRPVRETLPLRNLPDCLLTAYDGVSRRAFERFVARGSGVGSEIADWRSAERDLFLPITVELQETEDVVYAMATVPELSGAEIAVAVEDRWLLISGYMENLGGEFERGRETMRWIDFDDLYSVLKDEASAPVIGEEDSRLAPGVDSRPFCVVELPAGVDASRCVAVLADGVVAVRMPKVVVVVEADLVAAGV
jgi:HSP20 family molecular chaperone IbpA